VASLTRASILDAALAIADRDTPSGLTIRKLAGELGVTPMAIYWHFDSKAEIVAGLVEHVVGSADVTGSDADEVAAWLADCLERMYAGLVSHPGVLPLISEPAAVGPSSVAVMDGMLARLAAEGLSPAASGEVYFRLVSYTIGAAAVWRSVAAVSDRLGTDPFAQTVHREVDAVLASVSTD
jgi:AcrR family transcriptional regulator